MISAIRHWVVRGLRSADNAADGIINQGELAT